MLKTECNTRTMEERVLRAATKWYWHGIGPNQRRQDRRNCHLTSFFEHGQWWIENTVSGA